jgi:hypothetical protein
MVLEVSSYIKHITDSQINGVLKLMNVVRNKNEGGRVQEQHHSKKKLLILLLNFKYIGRLLYSIDK